MRKTLGLGQIEQSNELFMSLCLWLVLNGTRNIRAASGLFYSLSQFRSAFSLPPCHFPSHSILTSNRLFQAPGVRPQNCKAFLERSCVNNSDISQAPLLFEFTGTESGQHMPDPFPLRYPVEDIATFLLVRGPYAWIGYNWMGKCCRAPAARITTCEHAFSHLRCLNPHSPTLTDPPTRLR